MRNALSSCLLDQYTISDSGNLKLQVESSFGTINSPGGKFVHVNASLTWILIDVASGKYLAQGNQTTERVKVADEQEGQRVALESGMKAICPPIEKAIEEKWKALNP